MKLSNFFQTILKPSILPTGLEGLIYLAISIFTMQKTGEYAGLVFTVLFFPLIFAGVALRIALSLAISSLFQLFLTSLILNSFANFLIIALFSVLVKTNLSEFLLLAKVSAFTSVLAYLFADRKKKKKIAKIRALVPPEVFDKKIPSCYRIAIEIASVQLMAYLALNVSEQPNYLLHPETNFYSLAMGWLIAVLGSSLVNFIGRHISTFEFKYGFSILLAISITLFLSSKYNLSATKTVFYGCTLLLTTLLASITTASIKSADAP